MFVVLLMYSTFDMIFDVSQHDRAHQDLCFDPSGSKSLFCSHRKHTLQLNVSKWLLWGCVYVSEEGLKGKACWMKRRWTLLHLRHWQRELCQSCDCDWLTHWLNSCWGAKAYLKVITLIKWELALFGPPRMPYGPLTTLISSGTTTGSCCNLMRHTYVHVKVGLTWLEEIL